MPFEKMNIDNVIRDYLQMKKEDYVTACDEHVKSFFKNLNLKEMRALCILAHLGRNDFGDGAKALICAVNWGKNWNLGECKLILTSKSFEDTKKYLHNAMSYMNKFNYSYDDIEKMMFNK